MGFETRSPLLPFRPLSPVLVLLVPKAAHWASTGRSRSRWQQFASGMGIWDLGHERGAAAFITLPCLTLPYIALHCLASPRLALRRPPVCCGLTGSSREKRVGLGWRARAGGAPCGLLACSLACWLLVLPLLLLLLRTQFPSAPQSRFPSLCDHHLSDQTALNTTATYVRNCSIQSRPC